MTELIKKHDLAFETLRKSHSSQMDTKVKQYEGVILGKESEMKTELNLHQKTRN